MDVSVLAYVHEAMSHRADDGNITRLFERQGLVVVLEQHNGFLVQFSCKLHSFGAVDEFLPLLLRGSRVWVLEETHFKLGS